jgi:hypothetical protein
VDRLEAGKRRLGQGLEHSAAVETTVNIVSEIGGDEASRSGGASLVVENQFVECLKQVGTTVNVTHNVQAHALRDGGSGAGAAATSGEQVSQPEHVSRLRYVP